MIIVGDLRQFIRFLIILRLYGFIGRRWQVYIVSDGGLEAGETDPVKSIEIWSSKATIFILLLYEQIEWKNRLWRDVVWLWWDYELRNKVLGVFEMGKEVNWMKISILSGMIHDQGSSWLFANNLTIFSVPETTTPCLGIYLIVWRK